MPRAKALAPIWAMAAGRTSVSNTTLSASASTPSNSSVRHSVPSGRIWNEPNSQMQLSSSRPSHRAGSANTGLTRAKPKRTGSRQRADSFIGYLLNPEYDTTPDQRQTRHQEQHQN